MKKKPTKNVFVYTFTPLFLWQFAQFVCITTVLGFLVQIHYYLALLCNAVTIIIYSKRWIYYSSGARYYVHLGKRLLYNIFYFSIPLFFLFSLISLFWKNKRRLMRAPFRLSVCPSVFVHLSVRLCIRLCLSVYLPLIFLGFWGLWDHLAVCLSLLPIIFVRSRMRSPFCLYVCVSLPNFLFYARSVSYQRKLED
jgi:hypothetical protein